MGTDMVKLINSLFVFLSHHFGNFKGTMAMQRSIKRKGRMLHS